MNKPFGPALNAAVNLLTGNLQRDLAQLFGEEAKSLGLPDGTQVNMPSREWMLPEEPKSDAN